MNSEGIVATVCFPLSSGTMNCSSYFRNLMSLMFVLIKGVSDPNSFPNVRLSGFRMPEPSLRATYALLYWLSVMSLSILKMFILTDIFTPFTSRLSWGLSPKT